VNSKDKLTRRPFTILITLCLFISSVGQAADAVGLRPPDVAGSVHAKDGRPLKATVFVSTAAPKVGTTTFCPSCYADCRKSAVTDAQGNFTIQSLNPELIFRLLVVASGYKPKFVSRVDPLKSSPAVVLEPLDASQAIAGRAVRGRVVDSAGKPIAQAVIEPDEVFWRDTGQETGAPVPGMDPMAVTDEQGEFFLTAIKPFDSVHVVVEARGYAKNRFRTMPQGLTSTNFVLTDGAMVKGRLLLQGEPLGGVNIGIVGTNNLNITELTGLYVIGTDAKGCFAFVNMPPNTTYSVFGSIETLQQYGAVATREFRTGDDGSTHDLGDLAVSPGHRLSGRVVLSDGGKIPPKTRLALSRERIQERLQVELDPRGPFELRNLPADEYRLNVSVVGYNLSSKNRSLDTWNPSLWGRVDHDLTNMILVLDPGPPQPAGVKPGWDHLGEEPLRGVEESSTSK
jgi:hypothetical protein